ncbi:hypothetical protein ANN_25334 [Periplaneta americana]|uniref:Uncharacterized protein n=1 Tax=Periplaneta americana TaxID=6978 RepID=A0ABQ8S1E4_PERAM|nr:hypothetical protein ANN_25334 [Periplaneta americana]
MAKTRLHRTWFEREGGDGGWGWDMLDNKIVRAALHFSRDVRCSEGAMYALSPRLSKTRTGVRRVLLVFRLATADLRANIWKIFGAKRDEVTGEWRKLHNTELHALYSSPDIIRNIKSRHLRWAGHVARIGESRNAYRVLVGRPEGKRPLGRPRRTWEDNIKMDLKEVGYDDRDWINLAQDRDQWRAYVRAAMNLRIISRSMSTFVSRKKSILSRLRTSHNLRGIAQVAQHSIEKEHKILFDHTKVINKSSHYWDRTIKEAIEIKLEKNNFNRDSGLQLSQAWTPALDQLRPSYNQGHEDHGRRTATDSNRRNRARRPPNFTQESREGRSLRAMTIPGPGLADPPTNPVSPETA